MNKSKLKRGFGGDVSTAGFWYFECKLGRLTLFKSAQQNCWMIVLPAVSNADLEEFIAKYDLDQIDFATRRDALNCLETYAKDEGLL